MLMQKVVKEPLPRHQLFTAQRSFPGQKVSKTASKGAQNGTSLHCMDHVTVSSLFLGLCSQMPRNLLPSAHPLFHRFPVPIEMKYLTKGFKSPVFKHQIFDASPSTSSTGLFAPNPPSANVRSPMLTGSKNVVAADVARAA